MIAHAAGAPIVPIYLKGTEQAVSKLRKGVRLVRTEVWFGEPLPEGMMKEAEHAVGTAQVFLVIGTSAVVHPAAGLIPYARQAGAKVIEINPEPTAATSIVDCALQGPAGEILPQLIS